MRPTKSGEWEYVQEKPSRPRKGDGPKVSELDNRWDDSECEEPNEPGRDGEDLTVPLAGGDAAVIKKLSNEEAEENLGRIVQPDGRTDKHMAALKNKIKEWTTNVCGSQLPARAVWQSYTQQLWANVKYGLGA